MKKGYLWLLLGAIPAAGFAALAALNPTNVAETSESSETLQTRHYKTDLQNFVAETEKIIPTLYKTMKLEPWKDRKSVV